MSTPSQKSPCQVNQDDLRLMQAFVRQFSGAAQASCLSVMVAKLPDAVRSTETGLLPDVAFLDMPSGLGPIDRMNAIARQILGTDLFDRLKPGSVEVEALLVEHSRHLGPNLAPTMPRLDSQVAWSVINSQVRVGKMPAVDGFVVQTLLALRGELLAQRVPNINDLMDDARGQITAQRLQPQFESVSNAFSPAQLAQAVLPLVTHHTQVDPGNLVRVESERKSGPLSALKLSELEMMALGTRGNPAGSIQVMIAIQEAVGAMPETVDFSEKDATAARLYSALMTDRYPKAPQYMSQAMERLEVPSGPLFSEPPLAGRLTHLPAEQRTVLSDGSRQQLAMEIMTRGVRFENEHEASAAELAKRLAHSIAYRVARGIDRGEHAELVFKSSSKGHFDQDNSAILPEAAKSLTMSADLSSVVRSADVASGVFRAESSRDALAIVDAAVASAEQWLHGPGYPAAARAGMFSFVAALDERFARLREADDLAFVRDGAQGAWSNTAQVLHDHMEQGVGNIDPKAFLKSLTGMRQDAGDTEIATLIERQILECHAKPMYAETVQKAGSGRGDPHVFAEALYRGMSKDANFRVSRDEFNPFASDRDSQRSSDRAPTFRDAVFKADNQIPLMFQHALDLHRNQVSRDAGPRDEASTPLVDPKPFVSKVSGWILSQLGRKDPPGARVPRPGA